MILKIRDVTGRDLDLWMCVRISESPSFLSRWRFVVKVRHVECV